MSAVEGMDTVHVDAQEHHHETQNFWQKYIFCEDHKIIAKQYLITGIIWAVIGISMSVIFRIQLVCLIQTCHG